MGVEFKSRRDFEIFLGQTETTNFKFYETERGLNFENKILRRSDPLAIIMGQRRGSLRENIFELMETTGRGVGRRRPRAFRG